MNLLETYVTNITEEKDIYVEDMHLHSIKADFNCYGRIDKQITKIVSDGDYEMIKSEGYYLS